MKTVVKEWLPRLIYPQSYNEAVYIDCTAARSQREGYHFQCIECRGRLVCPSINFLWGCAPKPLVSKRTQRKYTALRDSGSFQRIHTNKHQLQNEQSTERSLLTAKPGGFSRKKNGYFLSRKSQWVDDRCIELCVALWRHVTQSTLRHPS